LPFGGVPTRTLERGLPLGEVATVGLKKRGGPRTVCP